jgi:hypothetical protein
MPADMDEMLTFVKMISRLKTVNFDDASDEDLHSNTEALNRLIDSARKMTEGATVTLNKRELATVLAALRAFARLGSEETEPENDIATCGGEFDALTVDEIDELCLEINCP